MAWAGSAPIEAVIEFSIWRDARQAAYSGGAGVP